MALCRRPMRLDKFPKYRGLPVMGDADAGILHLYAQHGIGQLDRPDDDMPFMGEFDRVGQQVDDDLAQSQPIAQDHLRQGRVDDDGHGQPLAFGQRMECGNARLQLLLKVHGFGFQHHLSRLDP